MEIEARRLPFEPKERNNSAALFFEVGDQRLILNVKHAQRQHVTPMLGQTVGFEIALRAIYQIVRKGQLSRVKLLKITGKADVSRIPPTKDDASTREQHRNSMQLEHVVRHFVSYTQSVAAKGAEALEVSIGKAAGSMACFVGAVSRMCASPGTKQAWRCKWTCAARNRRPSATPPVRGSRMA